MTITVLNMKAIRQRCADMHEAITNGEFDGDPEPIEMAIHRAFHLEWKKLHTLTDIEDKKFAAQNLIDLDGLLADFHKRVYGAWTTEEVKPGFYGL